MPCTQEGLEKTLVMVKHPISSIIYADTSCEFAVVVCPELMSPTNGRIELSSMVFGSTATYICDRGYNLNGSMSRVCMANEEWSGEDPLCQSKWNVSLHYVCVDSLKCMCLFIN